MTVTEKLALLRRKMKEYRLDAYIVYSADPHKSVAVADHWRSVRFLTGFTGWVGTVVVTADEAAFWTDGRYVEQAEKELAGSGIEQFCILDPDAPSLSQWTAANVAAGGRIGLDGRVVMVGEYADLQRQLSRKGISIETDRDIVGEMWADRPAIPSAPLFDYDVKYCGKSRLEKIASIRSEMDKLKVDWYITSGLDDIAWCSNLRGADSALYPIFHGFMLFSKKTAMLFVDDCKVSPELKAKLEADGITLCERESVNQSLSNIPAGQTLFLDPWKTSLSVLQSLQPDVIPVDGLDIATKLKSRKNSVELENLAEANIKEAVCVLRLIRRIKKAMADGDTVTEYDISQWIEDERIKMPGYIKRANIPIVGCRGNAVQLHYRPTREKTDILPNEGFLLFDVCAHYIEGSTDITRTVSLGTLTCAMKQDYTFTLKRHIQLATQKFMYGCTGPLLDAMIKGHYWNEGMNNPAGTGHGMGFFTYIQEGPCKIATDTSPFFHYTFTEPIEPGMIFSNEPGVYRSGSHAIRIENTIVAVDAMTTSYGRYLGFDTLTYIPLEREGILPELLTDAELEWVNGYLAETYHRLAPRLTLQEQQWLKEQTAPFHK